MAKYNFNLRNPKAEGATPVNLVARWSRNRLVYPTGECIAPAHWSTTKGQRNYQRAKETRAFPEHQEFNERLDVLLATVKKFFRQIALDLGRDPEPHELKLALDKATGKTALGREGDFLTFVEEYNGRLRARTNPTTGRAFHPTVHGRNHLTVGYLRSYAAKRRGRGTVPFSDLDVACVEGFAEYLTQARGLAVNTVGKYLRALRTFLNAADEQGKLQAGPKRLKKVTIPEERTEHVFLDEADLKALQNLDLSAELRLDRTRDVFLVGAWTGLRFGDWAALSVAHIDSERIRIRTTKTGQAVVIPMHPVVNAIIRKYHGQFPRPFSNRKLNSYIKEVVRRVPHLSATCVTTITRGGQKVSTVTPKWKLVSSHTARRSFASNLYKGGIPARTIMMITGHRSERAFLRYICLDGDQHADIIAGSDLFTNGAS